MGVDLRCWTLCAHIAGHHGSLRIIGFPEEIYTVIALLMGVDLRCWTLCAHIAGHHGSLRIIRFSEEV